MARFYSIPKSVVWESGDLSADLTPFVNFGVTVEQFGRAMRDFERAVRQADDRIAASLLAYVAAELVIGSPYLSRDAAPGVTLDDLGIE